MCDIIQELPNHHLKMIYTNLTTREIQPICIADAELNMLAGQTFLKIDDYWNWFMQSGLLHQDDIHLFRNFCCNAPTVRHLVYRRLINDSWHRVLMELTPCIDYTEQNLSMVIYVTDIEHIYEAEFQKVLDTVCSTDSMTGLRNRFGFQRDVSRLNGIVGVVYADINGLKHTNDTEGHKSGDKLITDFAGILKSFFPDDSCYRFGGDEFLVLCNDETVRDFRAKTKEFCSFIKNTEKMPLAAIGCSIDTADTLRLTISEAEQEMYADKTKYQRV